MKWDVILNTREYSKDYKFHLCPDYISTMQQMDDTEEALIRRFMRQIGILSYAVAGDGESDICKGQDRIAFIYDDDAFYLLRHVITKEQDERGRVIFATEGLICPKREEKLALLELADAVVYLLADKRLLRDKYFAGEISGTIDIPNQVNWIDNKELNPELFAGISEEYVSQLGKLVQLLSRERKLFAFVLGSMTNEMKSAIWEALPDVPVVDLSAVEKVSDARKTERIHATMLADEEHGLSLGLYYSLEQGKKDTIMTRWRVKDAANHTVLSTNPEEGRDVSMPKLSEQVHLLKMYLKYHGLSDFS